MVDINMGIINGETCTEQDYNSAIIAVENATKVGVKKIVITSRYSLKEDDVHSEEMKKRVEKLRGMLEKKKINVSIYYAQDIKMSRDVLLECLDNKVCSINETKYMLVDFGSTMTDEEVDMVFELTIKGMVPVIAHPERYQEIIDKIERIEKLKEIGCLLQLDIRSLEGIHGNEIKKIAKKLLKSGEYSFVATEEYSKNKDNSKYLKELLSKVQQDTFRKNGFKLLRNEEVSLKLEQKKQKRGLFSFS